MKCLIDSRFFQVMFPVSNISKFQSKNDSEKKLTLQEMMQQGREARRDQEQREASLDSNNAADIEGKKSDSDSDDDHMLIAGLSEVVSSQTLFRPPDKSVYKNYFSTKTYVVGTQKNLLHEMVLLSTQNT